MCYRLCELVQSFRDRCQESEKKFLRGVDTKNRKRQSAEIRPGPARALKKETVIMEFMEGRESGEIVYEDPIVLSEPPVKQEAMLRSTFWDDSPSSDCISEEETDTCIYPDADHIPTKKIRTERVKETRPRVRAEQACAPDTVFEVFKQGAKIWKHFTRCSAGRYAKCMTQNADGSVCNRILSMGTKSSTGVLHKHLKLRHHMEISGRESTQEVAEEEGGEGGGGGEEVV